MWDPLVLAKFANQYTPEEDEASLKNTTPVDEFHNLLELALS
jgi:hypothetical protein